MTVIAPTLQAFFTERLLKQRDASPRTIASYRDTIRLLLNFVNDTTGRQPSQLDWAELDEPVIGAFLQHLEHQRHNTPRTRNLRLTAIRSLFRHAALRTPNTPPRSNGYSASHPHGSIGGPSRSSPDRNARR
jgi:site-specific recombinase XerD